MNRNLFKKRTLWFTAFLMIVIWGLPEFLLAKEPLQCPQPRFTKKAPDEIYNLRNPLESTPENLKKGKMLYQTRAKPMPCKHCHGSSGDGRGPMARGFDPSPRDFTCTQTINGVPDGQLFWIIKNGSPGTGMLGFRGLKDQQIWQILLYVRQLAQ
jgi:Cytochrome c